jgi:hypothetical protein
LAQIDEQAEKQGAQEAIQAIGLFLREAIPMISQAPETLPMASEMLLFLVRRFRAGRGLESAVERAMKALEQKAEMAKQQQPGPPPEMMKMQADQQAEQMRMQAEMQLAQMKADFEIAKQNNELQIKAREMAVNEELERWKAELEAATQITIARMQNSGLDVPVIEAAAAQLTNELGGKMIQTMDQMALMHNQMANMHGESMNRLANMHGESMQNIGAAMQKINAPKRVIRGPDGLVIGVEAVQ